MFDDGDEADGFRFAEAADPLDDAGPRGAHAACRLDQSDDDVAWPCTADMIGIDVELSLQALVGRDDTGMAVAVALEQADHALGMVIEAADRLRLIEIGLFALEPGQSA